MFIFFIQIISEHQPHASLNYNKHMEHDQILRENLLALMKGEAAFMPFKEALKDFPMASINSQIPNSNYSPWFLLEHLRLAQQDILDFIVNPDYKYRKWPEDYWPVSGTLATPAKWKKSINDFESDFAKLSDLVKNHDTDLYHEIPWGSGEIFLREIITVSNHNAFHLGEFAMARQVMGTWGNTHRS
jgi:hypothetical protein